MEWPWQYSFPPFFTLQPHRDTRTKQLEAWRHLVLNYCLVNSVTSLDLSSASDLPLFNNTTISRRLSVESIQEVLEDLATRGNFEWSDKSKRRGLVFWRSPQQLGQEIHQWVSQTGQLGTVMTTLEILEEGDNNSWRGVSQEVLVKALRALECDNKCEIFDGDDGVKFF